MWVGEGEAGRGFCRLALLHMHQCCVMFSVASVLCDVDVCIKYVHVYKHMSDVPCKLHGECK